MDVRFSLRIGNDQVVGPHKLDEYDYVIELKLHRDKLVHVHGRTNTQPVVAIVVQQFDIVCDVGSTSFYSQRCGSDKVYVKDRLCVVDEVHGFCIDKVHDKEHLINVMVE